MALPGKQFGSVQSEGLDPNQDLTGSGCGYRALFDFQDLGPTCFVNDDGFHHQCH